MTRVIIFDLGGVVLRGNFMAQMLANAGATLNVSPARIRRVMRREEGPLERGEETDVAFWRRVCERLNVTPPSERVLVSLLRHHYATHSKIDPAVRTIIRLLRRTCTVVALTNTNKAHTAINRPRGLFRIFDRAFISCDMGMRKPERRAFLHIARICKVPRKSLLLIDDDPRWVAAARQHGVPAIRFVSTRRLSRQLRRAGIVW